MDLHQDNSSFRRRPLTTFLIDEFSSKTGKSVGFGFVFVNFLGLFLSGILLFYLSRSVGANHRQGLLNMVFYFLTFSNLFAFFAPVYTYDEPLQFCFLFFSLWMLHERKWLFYLLGFFLAVLARESSVVLLPAIYFFFIGNPKNPRSFFAIKNIAQGLFLSLPFFLYLGFFFWQKQTGQNAGIPSEDIRDRFHLIVYNFHNAQFAIETISSFILALAFPLFLALQFLKQQTESNKLTLFIKAFLLTTILNTLIVLFGTQARETRLFVLPLFFIWSIFTQAFGGFLKQAFNKQVLEAFFQNKRKLALFLLICILIFVFSFHAYRSTSGVGSDHFFNEYLFLLLCLVAFFKFRT